MAGIPVAVGMRVRGTPACTTEDTIMKTTVPETYIKNGGRFKGVVLEGVVGF